MVFPNSSFTVPRNSVQPGCPQLRRMAPETTLSQRYAKGVLGHHPEPGQCPSGLTKRFDWHQGRAGVASVYGIHAGAPQLS